MPSERGRNPKRRREPRRRNSTEQGFDGLGGGQVEGRRAVRELLAVGRRQVRHLWVADGLPASSQLDEIEALARRRHVRVETVPRARIVAHARTEAPQGVVAEANPIVPVALEDLCSSRGDEDAFLLVVSGVTDPQNLGSLLRSAECAGVTGVVLARHRSAHLSPTVAKAAAGALEHLDFSVVGGIPNALTTLSSLGVTTVGLAGESPESIYETALAAGPVALVVGGEERGIPPLARRRCDYLLSIPQHGSLPSLNVAVAGAIGCFEIARRRVSSTNAGPKSAVPSAAS